MVHIQSVQLPIGRLTLVCGFLDPSRNPFVNRLSERSFLIVSVHFQLSLSGGVLRERGKREREEGKEEGEAFNVRDPFGCGGFSQ